MDRYTYETSVCFLTFVLVCRRDWLAWSTLFIRGFARFLACVAVTFASYYDVWTPSSFLSCLEQLSSICWVHGFSSHGSSQLHDVGHTMCHTAFANFSSVGLLWASREKAHPIQQRLPFVHVSIYTYISLLSTSQYIKYRHILVHIWLHGVFVMCGCMTDRWCIAIGMTTLLQC